MVVTLDKCLGNFTVMKKVDDFFDDFDKIKSFSSRERRFIRSYGFRTKISEICESKRDIARTMTDSIQPLANFCVGNEKIRKQFVLNALLLLETILDFVCNMSQDIYEGIYESNSEQCLEENMKLLKECQRKSFDLYFWEKVPARLSLVRLLNGAVCKYYFVTMRK